MKYKSSNSGQVLLEGLLIMTLMLSTMFAFINLEINLLQKIEAQKNELKEIIKSTTRPETSEKNHPLDDPY